MDKLGKNIRKSERKIREETSEERIRVGRGIRGEIGDCC